jgi:hypothetical protein
MPGREHDQVMVEVWMKTRRSFVMLDDGELNSEGPGM